MDETVTLRALLLIGLRGLLGLLGSAAAFAHAGETLPDPTRPPAALLLQSGAAELSAEPPGPRVQSILIARRPSGRHVALIDGDTVRLGENYKGAVVARMTETEVVLVRGKQRQVLTLFPLTAKQAK